MLFSISSYKNSYEGLLNILNFYILIENIYYLLLLYVILYFFVIILLIYDFIILWWFYNFIKFINLFVLLIFFILQSYNCIIYNFSFPLIVDINKSPITLHDKKKFQPPLYLRTVKKIEKRFRCLQRRHCKSQSQEKSWMNNVIFFMVWKIM